MDHSVVEIVKLIIFQFLAVYEIPLAAGILVAPAVAFAREVYPFRMAELIAHEVKVTAVDGRGGHKSDHLVESHAAGHCHIVVILHHVPVHLLVDQAENHSFVSDKSPVVALYIRDCLFIGTAVGQFPEYRSRMPVLVLLLLESLDPVIGNTHSHTVVKPYAAVLDRHSPDRAYRSFPRQSLWHGDLFHESACWQESDM